ncbi:MAG: cell division FtsZ family protein [Chthoniobacterales bacterium]|nr:cell division FtsZ family protein [Chthoniobacterales bacterium]
MINLGPNALAAAPFAPVSTAKIFGVGGAGLALLERLAPMPLGRTELVAAGTDARSLMNSSVVRKVQIGREGTKGLGSGGDATVGEGAARESAAEIRAECEGAQVVVVCAGLGGGTGSGAAPVIAHEAQRKGALVVGVVTMPLVGEGGQRREQAERALARLARSCTAILCFENDRLNELGPEGMTISDAFNAASQTLATAAAAVVRMVGLPAILRLGVDELVQVFQGSSARCEFGCGFASGPDRVRSAVEEAMRSPLLESGKLLGESESVLVHITGDSSLKLTEVHSALRQISQHVEENAQVMLGVATDPEAEDIFGVVIMACKGAGADLDGDEEDFSKAAEETSGEDAVPEDGTAKPAKSKARTKTPRRTATAEQKQEELPLDQAMRGRFKDLDPTMVDGQDLDVPTFIRMRIRLK